MFQYKPPTLQKVSTKELIEKVTEKSSFEPKIVKDITEGIFEEITKQIILWVKKQRRFMF